MIGVEIHGYRVERALSEDKGGFGDVYFARHSTSGAEAVLKVLKPEMSAHREIVTRFFNEARAAASVQHPGIVAVHNVGYVHDRAYLLMERLRGEDLETRLARGPLPLESALRFLRQAAGAIGAAHERGIVHRDLKPANLFVVPDVDVVGGERIKVLDFGIAKLGTTGTMKTQGVFGTPAYMAPEQCSNAADVDGRSDQYALGCILYEMIAGSPPFGHGGLELIASHLRDEPAPLRARVPGVPAAVDALAMRLLRKSRDERFPSCAALIAAIDGIAATGPSLPAAPPIATSAQAATVAAPSSSGGLPLASAASTGASSLGVPMARRPVRVARWIAGGVLVIGVIGAGALLRSSGGGADAKDGIASGTTAAAKGMPSASTPSGAASGSAEQTAARYQACWASWDADSSGSFDDCFAHDLAPDVLAEATQLRRAFPDLHIRPTLVLVNGAHVASTALVTGTMRNDLGMPMGTARASNQRIGLLRGDAVELDAAGRATRRWAVLDDAELLAQAGAIAGPARPLVDAPDAPEVVLARHDGGEDANVARVIAAIDAFDRHDAGAFGAPFADDVVWSSSASAKDGGKPDLVGNAQTLWDMFDDTRLEAAATWGAGDYVASAGTLGGTPRAQPGAAPAPAPARFAIPYVVIAKLRGGRIVRWSIFYDTLAFKAELHDLPRLLDEARASGQYQIVKPGDALSAGETVGGLTGDEAGEMKGGYGYGSAGGAAATDGAIGTGRYGTIGHGNGSGSGYGVGGGSAQRTSSAPRTAIGQPKAAGELDKAILRRYIKRNLEKITYCYEKALLAKPSLKGTVVVQFFIKPDGTVGSAAASGLDPDVAACVAGVIKGIEFPPPKGGGGVQVNYPFTFSPASG